MNHDFSEKISPADPRLTAYAFGELEGDELKLIEAAVQADPALQAAVAGLRGFGDTLTSVLGDEPANENVDGDLRAPAPAAGGAEAKPKKRRGLIIPFPLHYLATAAAACFAVVVWMRHEGTAEAPQLKAPVAPQVRMQEEARPVAVKAMPAVRFDASLGSENDSASIISKESKNTAAGAASIPVAGTLPPVDVAVAAASVPVSSPAPSTDQVSRLLADGRSQYPAGNLREADAPIGGVLAASPENAEAKAFSARIAKDKTADTRLGAVRTRAAMVDEVSSAWQRSAGYVSDESSASSMQPSVRFVGSDAYVHPVDNPYRSVAAEPLSTFSVDVDTASYSNVRRFLAGGRLPPSDAVRIEELINYFPYRYAPPVADSDKNAAPFAAHLEVASAPWAPAHRLVRIGLKGRELTAAMRPPANLVFLLDVSGSMNRPNRLPLVKESLRLLVERLRPDDRVAIVTYAGNSGLALPSTPASQKREILASLDGLRPGGSTNGAMGIHLAYDIAKANFADGGLNRVILCTDGDFNVGVTDRGELTRLVAEKAKSRVFLSVFGFGMGNYKDATLESLADKGNGAYGYIDTRREAEKVFVEQAEGTLATIAKDVKVQVEFNPARVQSYRLIGYENRILAKEDFNNDAVDAGDIGAGHTVTALYEIVPAGVEDDAAARPAVDPLKYQKAEGGARTMEVGGRRTESRELLTVKIRYKAPEGDVSAKQEFPLIDGGRRFEQASGEFRFASAVAAWGMLLRDSPHKGAATFEQVQAWAENALGDDTGGYRSEFIQLVRRSAELSQ